MGSPQLPWLIAVFGAREPGWIVSRAHLLSGRGVTTRGLVGNYEQGYNHEHRGVNWPSVHTVLFSGVE